MEFNFLIDVELFSEFDEDAVDGVEVVAVVTPGGCKVKDNEVIVLTGTLQRLMVLIPIDEQSLLADSSISLDDKWFVVLGGDVHIEPLLDHEVIFF
jgi:hypothetical protein